MTKSSGKRRTISVDEETYKALVRAKAELELEEEEDISLSQAVGAIVIGGLAVYGLAKLMDEYNKRR